MAGEDSTTPTTLAWFVNAEGEDLAFATACDTEARALVENFIGTTEEIPNPFQVPQEIVDRAVLEVGADLYYRKATRNGIVSFGGDADAPTPLRISRDPLAAAYPLLRQYIPFGL